MLDHLYLNNDIDIVVSSLHLSESNGIELKSFSFNINYNRVSSIVVMYTKLYSLCPSILKLPSGDRSSPSDLFDIFDVDIAADAFSTPSSLKTDPPPFPPAIIFTDFA